jgi:hypothetical protein
MAHRIAPEAEAELDNIWDYVADEMRTCALACVLSRGRVRHHLPTQRGGRADSPRSPGQPEHRGAIAVVTAEMSSIRSNVGRPWIC